MISTCRPIFDGMRNDSRIMLYAQVTSDFAISYYSSYSGSEAKSFKHKYLEKAAINGNSYFKLQRLGEFFSNNI